MRPCFLVAKELQNVKRDIFLAVQLESEWPRDGRPLQEAPPPRYDGGAGLSGAVTSHAQRGTRLHCTRRRAGGSAAATGHQLRVAPPRHVGTTRKGPAGGAPFTD